MMFKRKLSVLVVMALAVSALAACGSKGNEAETPMEITGDKSASWGELETDEKMPEEVTEEASEPDKSEATAETSSTSDNNAEEAKQSLPAYTYPGPEQFYFALYEYLVENLSKDYAEADVSIPCPIIVYEDDSNKEDICVYGNFWIFNYNLKGDVLENVSGGSYPGCIHMKLSEAGFEVTGMDVVEDGSNYDESAKKIFGDHYDGLTKATSDDKARETTRAQIIANYVAANNLQITAYQDYGWDPVTLPEENIDSFYSQLD